MLPLLEFAADDRDHSFKECVKHLADVLRLTGEERRQLLPSGRQEVFKNRAGWAKWHLQLAGLIVIESLSSRDILDHRVK